MASWCTARTSRYQFAPSARYRDRDGHGEPVWPDPHRFRAARRLRGPRFVATDCD